MSKARKVLSPDGLKRTSENPEHAPYKAPHQHVQLVTRPLGGPRPMLRDPLATWVYGPALARVRLRPLRVPREGMWPGAAEGPVRSWKF